MSTVSTVIEVTESVSEIAATGDQISINLTDDVTTIQAYNLAVPTAVPGVIDASSVTVQAHNTIPSGFLDNALKVLADQIFRSDTQPSGDRVEQGDIWYETDTETLYIYREVSPGTFEWQPIAIGAADSDTLDGGLY